MSKITLENVVDSANTGADAIKRAPILTYKTDMRCLRIQDISQKKDFSEWGYTEVSPKDWERFGLRKNEIIVARTGGSIGVNKFIESDLKSVFNNGLIRLRIDTSNFYPKYIYYCLNSRDYKYHIDSIAHGTSTQPNMKIRDLLRFKITNFNLEEQRAIAHILGSLDDKIEANRRMNETLENTARAIFKSWFVDFDPVHAKANGEIPEGMSAETADLFPDDFQESELGLIPSGWEVGQIEDDFDVTLGQSPPSKFYNEDEVGLPFYQGKTDFGFRFPSRRVYCTQPKRLADFGDTLLSVRAPVGDVNMAIEECCIGRGVSALRHKSGSSSYTYYSIQSLGERFKVYDNSGTVFGSISGRDLKAMKFILPAENIVYKFDEISSALDDRIRINEQENRTLTELRDTLLPRLISGELRVEDVSEFVGDV